LGLFPTFLPVFEDIYQEVLVGFIEGDIIGEAKEMVHIGVLWIGEIVLDRLRRLHGGVHMLKEILVIGFLDAEDEVAAK